MTASENYLLMKLSKVHEDTEAFHMIEQFIRDHFAMVEHMKETSLYDVYLYEERFAKINVEPMRILAHDNERLKKEVNKLRKQLSLTEKYKEKNNETLG